MTATAILHILLHLVLMRGYNLAIPPRMSGQRESTHCSLVETDVNPFYFSTGMCYQFRCAMPDP
jgi:hypothetical protein